MRLYLLRHAVAVERGTPGFVNDDRPLTEDGIERMKKAARGIFQNIEHIDLILTSPLRRAAETAKIVASEFHCSEKIKIVDFLLPGASIKKFIEELSRNRAKQDILIVGHDPDLADLAAELMGENSPSLEFKKGGICRIDVDTLPSRRSGRLQWHLTPKQLRAMAKQKKSNGDNPSH